MRSIVRQPYRTADPGGVSAPQRSSCTSRRSTGVNVTSLTTGVWVPMTAVIAVPKASFVVGAFALSMLGNGAMINTGAPTISDLAVDAEFTSTSATTYGLDVTIGRYDGVSAFVADPAHIQTLGTVAAAAASVSSGNAQEKLLFENITLATNEVIILMYRRASSSADLRIYNFIQVLQEQP
jgi:hypothetical protein